MAVAIKHAGAGGAVVVVVAPPTVITMIMSTLWVSEPLEPVIRNVKVPVEAVGSALMVNVDEAELPDGGVIGLESEKVTPVGALPNHDGARVTGEPNPLSEVTEIVAPTVPA